MRLHPSVPALMLLLLQSSIYVRDWVLDHWAEGQAVNLAEELPELKILVLEAREREDRILAEQAQREAEETAAREAALADSFEHHRNRRDDRYAGLPKAQASQHHRTSSQSTAHHAHASQSQATHHGYAAQPHAQYRTHTQPSQPQADQYHGHHQGGVARHR